MKFRRLFLPAVALSLTLPGVSAAAEHRLANGPLTFVVDDATGDYSVTDGFRRFAGKLPGGATTVTGG